MAATLLIAFRARNDLRIDDLVHLAADVVPRLAGPQLRYKVTSLPDARTIRYYVQQGLVDPPHATAGAAAIYGYRHLLQVVLVKVLQAHYLPIRQIRQTIEKLTDRELEKLLEGWKSPGEQTIPEPALHAGSAIDAAAGWQRHELYPGIELHVHDGAAIPSGSSFPSVLASRLRVILEKLAASRRAAD